MDDLDRILLADERITPSASFGRGVMDAVDALAVEPASLPFPWARLATGVLACAALTACAAWLDRMGGFSSLALPLSELAGVSTELGYAAATVAFSLAVVSVQKARARMAVV